LAGVLAHSSGASQHVTLGVNGGAYSHH
jgi:hypothetical protein